jgi:uncharacterized protein DUF3558
MRTMYVVCCLSLTTLLAGCGGTGASAQSAGQSAAALTGEEKIAADKSPQCRLFTPAELAKFAGLPLGPGRVAAMGTGCQWLARSGEGSVMIQAAPARYHEPHKGAKGFRRVPDVGKEGFVESSMGGWNAGAIDGAQTVVVAVDGPAASDATAIALLTETIKRRK